VTDENIFWHDRTIPNRPALTAREAQRETDEAIRQAMQAQSATQALRDAAREEHYGH